MQERAPAPRNLCPMQWRQTRHAYMYGYPRKLLSVRARRSEEHTSELQSLMRISYAVFCLKKKINNFFEQVALLLQTIWLLLPPTSLNYNHMFHLVFSII